MNYKLKKVFKIYELNYVKNQIILKEPSELDYENEICIFSSYDTEEEAVEALNERLEDIGNSEFIIQAVYEISYSS